MRAKSALTPTVPHTCNFSSLMFSDAPGQRLLEDMQSNPDFISGVDAPTVVRTGSLPRRTIRLEPETQEQPGYRAEQSESNLKHKSILATAPNNQTRT